MLVAALMIVAFLRSGDVWIQPADGGTPTNVTRTGGRVEDFRFSTAGDYLAYAKRIRRSEERPITSIVVMRTDTRRVMREITPQEGWVDIDKWLGSRLIYHSSAAMEVNGVFEFDAASGTRRALDPQPGSQAMDSDASADGSVLAYVDDEGVGASYQSIVHVRDERSGTDLIQARKRSAMAPSIAPDRRAVAFLEVVDGAVRGQGRDRVWVARAGEDPVMVYDAPVQAKGGGSGLTWSPDGERLAINFGGRTTAIDPSAPGRSGRQFSGTDACWIDARQLVVATADGVSRIDVETGESRVLVSIASRPQCLASVPGRQ